MMEEQFNFNVNMDNLRQNLISYYNLVQDKLPDLFNKIKDETKYHTFLDFVKLIQAIDELSGVIGALLCVFSYDQEDLFSDMSDKIDSLKTFFKSINTKEIDNEKTE